MYFALERDGLIFYTNLKCKIDHILQEKKTGRDIPQGCEIEIDYYFQARKGIGTINVPIYSRYEPIAINF